MTTRRTLRLGTISDATLRPEDVVPALLETLATVAPAKATRLQRDFDAIPEDDTDGLASELWDEAVTALEDYTPAYAYVGALEGDGACIGVWPSVESLEDAVRDGEAIKVNDLGDPRVRQHVGPIMQVSDHGNVTCYTRFRNGRVREEWSVV
jgi:hypothetical protein